MNKLQKRVLIVLCIGVFLCGIGAGVAFVEFSSLTYGGKQIIGEVDMRTENIDVKFEEGEEACVIYGFRSHDLIIDNSVPKNTVRFCVTYNAKYAEPYAYWDKEREEIVFSYYWHDNDEEMPFVMEAKDIFLQNLKEGKLVSFERPQIKESTILVNEEDVDNVWVEY